MADISLGSCVQRLAQRTGARRRFLRLATALFWPGSICIHGVLLCSIIGCGAEQIIVVKPGDDLQAAMDRVAESGTVVLTEGMYNITKPLRITKTGMTLKAKKSRTAHLIVAKNFEKNEGGKGQLLRIESPNVTIQGLTMDGQFVKLVKAIDASDTVIVEGHEGNQSGAKIQKCPGNKLLVEECEIFHFAHHALDIDTNDSTVRNCLIHEILWNDNGGRQDAHGIVTTNAQRLVIEKCRIANCSGDSVQGERGAWDHLWIVNCDLGNEPLKSDLGGFKQGDYVGENAFDSKHARGSRGRLAILWCKMHGFRSKFISNAAAINLKENIDAVVDSCDICDSEIAFRLRGKSYRGILWPVVMNCVIRGNDIAFRFEDMLQKFRLFHCTIYKNSQDVVWAPRLTKWHDDRWDKSGWAIVNNLWIAAPQLPHFATRKDLSARHNLIVSRDRVNDRLIPTSGIEAVESPPLVDRWYESTGRIVKDRNGARRSQPSTVGAFETRAKSRPQNEEKHDQGAAHLSPYQSLKMGRKISQD